MKTDRSHATKSWKAAAWALLLAFPILAGSAVAEEEVHWTYSGEHGRISGM